MNKFLIFWGMVGFCLSISACGVSGNHPDKALQGIDLPIEDFNDRFRLHLRDIGKNDHKNGDMILLVVENLYDEPIFHNQQQDTKLFASRNGEWVPIENGLIYGSGTREISIFPQAEQIGRFVTGVIPIAGDASPIVIRIVLLGRLEKEGSDQIVGAYLDVTLAP